MNNLEDALRETIYSQDATFFTGVSKEADFTAVMQMISFIENDSLANRIITSENPMRIWAIGGSAYVIGHTERLKTDSNYYEKFIKMCKLIDLDNEFLISNLGNSLEMLKELKKTKNK